MQFKISNFNIDKIRLVNRLFQITVALWFLRMVLPGVKYVFFPAMVLLLVSVLLSFKTGLFKKAYVFEFLKTFNPLLILGLFFGLGFVLSDQLYEKPLRDLAEYLVNLLFLIVFFALTYYSRHDEGFFWVFRRMSRVIWITSVLVAFIGIVKFVFQNYGVEIFDSSPWGTAINDDKNFYALYSFLGLIGLYPRIAGSNSIKKRLVSMLLVFVLITNIIFSFSPRSLFLLLILFLGLVVFQFVQLLRKRKQNLYVLALNLLPLTALLFVVGFFSTTYYSKNNDDFQKLTVNYFGEEIAHQLSADGDVSSAFPIDKWEYAIDYFQQKPWLMRIFGGGFDYLPVFGKEFNGNAQIHDYPHNPVLSSLLYSGIVGAVFAVFFLMVALYYSLIYFSRHPLFSMMLLVCSMFVLFSGNSLFSVPIFLFLFSLAFLVRHQEISELKLVPNLNKPGSKFVKETFDYLLASVSLVILSPLLIVVSLIVGFTMGFPVVFTQTRIGQNGKPFKLHKFRSMKKIKPTNTTVAAAEQNRLTSFGKFMRKYKLDELPELWNIIRGDMSFVGPRPDVPGYADELKGEDRDVLQLKPGLTGAASLKYMHEEELLAKQEDPQEYNDKVIFPDKVLVNKKYMQKWTLLLDLKIIALTAMGKAQHEDKFL
jgi:lipopolysaccharide/colanic/teichoic acid biosynthesis glycosyltransferase